MPKKPVRQRRGCPKPPKPHRFGLLVIPKGAMVKGRSLVRGGGDERPISQRWEELE